MGSRRAKTKIDEIGNENVQLPDEVIYNHILPRLPVKSLMRFKCVCKSWNLLIRDPLFARLRKKFHSCSRILMNSFSSYLHFVSVLVHEDGNLAPAVDLLTLSTDSFWMVQSLNGFVCIYHPWCWVAACIFNPSTGEFVTLHADGTLGTWPSLVSYHFGFTDRTNEYKVLRLRHEVGPTRIECEIYTLGSGSWRHIDPAMSFDPNEFPLGTEPTCVNGVLHWMFPTKKSIVAFDVGDECFGEIEVPDGYSHVHLDMGALLLVRGRLAMMDAGNLFGQNLMEVWVLEDYQNHVWTKEQIRFPFDWLQSDRPVPVGTIHTGELLLAPTVSVPPMSILFYDMKGKSFRRVEVDGLPEHFLPETCSSGKYVTIYEESIMSLGAEA